MTDEYTPTVEEVRGFYDERFRGGGTEFDRMIAVVERAAAVKALREAAEHVRNLWAVEESVEAHNPTERAMRLQLMQEFEVLGGHFSGRADRIESGEQA
jgi:hypothetical protein